MSQPTATELDIEEAVERWIRKRSTNSTHETVRGYKSRLDQWLKWCENNNVETVADLDAWTLDDWQLYLGEQGYAPTTVKGRLITVRLFLEYLEGLELVYSELSETIDVPNLSKQEEQNEERLDTDHATAALSVLRDSPEHYATIKHTLLELAWHTGARLGGLQALDLSDFHPDEQAVEFRHRPQTGTPLKNKSHGERWVGLSEEVVDVIRYYIARERSDRRDEHGREPLLCGRQGRFSKTSIQAYSYQATHPCLWEACPHGKRRETCRWTQRNHASKCPSSRAPHRIRTGSITWQLNTGVPIEVVAERVNATVETIKQYYDQATARESFEQRRQSTEMKLDITGNHEPK